jgi:hypothetical protein
MRYSLRMADLINVRGMLKADAGDIVIRPSRTRTNARYYVIPSTRSRVDHRRRSAATTRPDDATDAAGSADTVTTAPFQRGSHPMALRSADRALSPVDVALRVSIVGLALATGYIHSTLGGLLFTLNAVGYLVAAVAMVIPLSLAVRYRWVVRLGLMGYAATTILGWAIQGPYYSTAYIAKGIEVALIVLLAIDFARMDGNPVTVIRNEIAQLQARFGRRPATNSSNA